MSMLTPILVAASLLAEAAPPAADKPAPPAATAEKETPDVRALADKVIARYASARSYRDRGTGSIEMGMAGVPPKPIEFHTAFRRDGGMLWSFSSSSAPGGGPMRPYVVWSNDLKSWNSWWALDGETKSGQTAQLAFGAPVGISRNLSIIVPALLGVDGTGERFFDFRFSGMRIVGTEELDGTACEILEGRTRHFGDTNRLWIDKTGAIRRFRSITTVDPSKMELPKSVPAAEAARMRARPKFDTVTTFDFEPVFDGEVTDKDTEFTPPAAEGED